MNKTFLHYLSSSAATTSAITLLTSNTPTRKALIDNGWFTPTDWLTAREPINCTFTGKTINCLIICGHNYAKLAIKLQETIYRNSIRISSKPIRREIFLLEKIIIIKSNCLPLLIQILNTVGSSRLRCSIHNGRDWDGHFVASGEWTAHWPSKNNMLRVSVTGSLEISLLWQIHSNSCWMPPPSQEELAQPNFISRTSSITHIAAIYFGRPPPQQQKGSCTGIWNGNLLYVISISHSPISDII